MEITFKKNFVAPFYGWSSTTSRLEPLRGGSLLFTTKLPEIPGTQKNVRNLFKVNNNHTKARSLILRYL